MNSARKRSCWSLYKEDMKTIRVVAAVIRSEDKIFATARGYGEFKGQWEFPGGKIESGEAMMVIRTSPFIAHRSS